MDPEPSWYLDLLPCLYYSSKVVKSMRVTGLFDDAYLVSHILMIVHWNWQDQYKLNGAMLPQVSGSFLKSWNTAGISICLRAALNPVTLPKEESLLYLKDSQETSQRKASFVLQATQGHTNDPQYSEIPKVHLQGHPKEKLNEKDAHVNITDPRNLIEAEVAMCNYWLKSRN